MSYNRPYSNTRLVYFLSRRISELKGHKPQARISAEAGFRAPNVLSMIKLGSIRLPLDRVPELAKALECDPALLFRLALEQMSGEATSMAIDKIFGTVVTENESNWLEGIRAASDNSDPSFTRRAENAIRDFFGKR